MICLLKRERSYNLSSHHLCCSMVPRKISGLSKAVFSTKSYIVRASGNKSCIHNCKQKQQSTLLCPVHQNILPFSFVTVSCLPFDYSLIFSFFLACSSCLFSSSSLFCDSVCFSVASQASDWWSMSISCISIN